ncbi:MAG TPA: hypothetical protein VNT00_15700 [Eoetvoesiella sp.]|uniref:hypothetical protein n=1 Tax=Eoetvoesiella sp. TaxID=1966355 RepID=UPI002B6E8CC2|nr:hypothetical protein [Eoetvoesiella sp.]HWK62867.1 hypothetical protein [Eoetvoesiella sp.]
MKNLTDPGAGRSAYVDTDKPGNAEPAVFSWLPAGLGLKPAARGVTSPRKALSLAAGGAWRSAGFSPNAISLIWVNRP